METVAERNILRHKRLRNEEAQIPCMKGLVAFDNEGYSTPVNDECAGELAGHPDWEVISLESYEDRLLRERRQRVTGFVNSIIRNIALLSEEVNVDFALILVADGSVIDESNSAATIEEFLQPDYTPPVAKKVQKEEEEPPAATPPEPDSTTETDNEKKADEPPKEPADDDEKKADEPPQAPALITSLSELPSDKTPGKAKKQDAPPAKPTVV